MVKASNVDVVVLHVQLKEATTIEACARTKWDKLDMLERRKSTNCNAEAISRKVANAQGSTNDLFTSSIQSTLDAYDFFRRTFRRFLLLVF